jgi:hypothetical protein
MMIGSLVREIETDPEWILHPGEVGVIIRPADEDMGLNIKPEMISRHWEILWSDGLEIVLDTDLEVVA